MDIVLNLLCCLDNFVFAFIKVLQTVTAFSINRIDLANLVARVDSY